MGKKVRAFASCIIDGNLDKMKMEVMEKQDTGKRLILWEMTRDRKLCDKQTAVMRRLVINKHIPVKRKWKQYDIIADEANFIILP